MHGTGDVNTPQEQDVDAENSDPDQQPLVPEVPPTASLRRSSRDRVLSTRYPLDEYVVLLSNGS